MWQYNTRTHTKYPLETVGTVNPFSLGYTGGNTLTECRATPRLLHLICCWNFPGGAVGAVSFAGIACGTDGAFSTYSKPIAISLDCVCVTLWHCGGLSCRLTTGERKIIIKIIVIIACNLYLLGTPLLAPTARGRKHVHGVVTISPRIIDSTGVCARGESPVVRSYHPTSPWRVKIA